MPAYIYAVRSALIACFKIGYWTSTLESLRARYHCHYGSHLEWHVYECTEGVNPKYIENDVHKQLSIYWKSFDIACIDAYRSAVKSLCCSPVQMPLSRREATRKRKQQAALTRQINEKFSEDSNFSKQDVLHEVLMRDTDNIEVKRRAICVRALITTLGFEHPLDNETIISTLHPMKELSFVQHWDRNASMFLGKKPVPGKALDERGLHEICRAVLKTIGIGLTMDFKRPRQADGTQAKVRRYKLNKESCESMGELMVLKGVRATQWPAAEKWLEAHPLKRWAHLKL